MIHERKASHHRQRHPCAGANHRRRFFNENWTAVSTDQGLQRITARRGELDSDRDQEEFTEEGVKKRGRIQKLKQRKPPPYAFKNLTADDHPHGMDVEGSTLAWFSSLWLSIVGESIEDVFLTSAIRQPGRTTIGCTTFARRIQRDSNPPRLSTTATRLTPRRKREER